MLWIIKDGRTGTHHPLLKARHPFEQGSNGKYSLVRQQIISQGPGNNAGVLKCSLKLGENFLQTLHLYKETLREF